MRFRAGGSRERGALGGDYWAIAAYLAVPAIGLLLLALALPPDPPPAFGEERLASIRERVEERTRGLQEWTRVLAELCREPRLLQLGLGPSCADGTITLPDAEFFDPDLRALRPEAEDRLRQGVSILFESLRSNERIWRQVEVIEVRGHADPRALRDPYVTNLHISKERAAAVLLFLANDEGLPERDRLDLRRLAVTSAAAHSRPPTDCRVRSSECDAKAKRVEIRIGLDPDPLRREIGDFHDELIESLTP